MAPTLFIPWLLLGASLGLAICGIGIIVRGDRAKFRLSRCPCGYDLRATSGPACPECGFQFRNKRALWARCDRTIIIGIILLLTALPAIAITSLLVFMI